MNSLNTKPTIVFDLDETLIHATPIPPYGLEDNGFFTILVRRKKFFVQTRPNLLLFLEKISKLFNICIFTSSDQRYANKIIDKILPNVTKCCRFFRDSCIEMCGYLVKDLNLINASPKQVLLVDDSVGSALKNPSNLVKIKPWSGEKDDRVLEDLLFILEKIAFDGDLTQSFYETVKNGNFEGIGTF